MSNIQPVVVNNAPSTPKVSLPTFSGKQEEWESFKQRFSSLIKDNQSLSEVTKLQHLLNALQGSAGARLKGIEIIPTNFQGACDLLIRRYDNPHIRLSKHLETLIQLPVVHTRSVSELMLFLMKQRKLFAPLRI